MNRPDPYINYQPGDLITAESTDEMQVLIKEDIAKNVGAIETEFHDFMGKPVDAAKFGGKIPTEWTAYYDERYVAKAELKDGLGLYRRYFKTLDRVLANGRLESAIIEHNLGRFPVVEVSELLPLNISENPLTNDDVAEGTNADQYRFLVYYATATDRASDKLRSRGNDKVFWGDPLALMMEQFKKTAKDTQRVSDVLNDLWGAMFDPGDDQDRFDSDKYGFSRYIDENVIHDRLTFAQANDTGIWDDLRMAIRPRLLSTGIEIPGLPLAVPHGDNEGVSPAIRVEIFHLSQNAIEIQVSRAADLMVVVRS